MQNQENESNFWRNEFLKQQKDIDRLQQTVNRIRQENQQMISIFQSNFSQFRQTQTVAAQLVQQIRADFSRTESVVAAASKITEQIKANFLRTESAVATTSKITEQIRTNFSRTESAVSKIAKEIKNNKSPFQSIDIQQAIQLEQRMKFDLLNTQPAIRQLEQIQRQMKRDLSNTQPAIQQLDKIQQQMNRDLLNARPAIQQLDKIQQQMNSDLLNARPAIQQLDKIQRRMNRDFLNVQPAIQQLDKIQRQRNRDLLTLQPVTTKLTKKIRIELLQNRPEISEETLFPVEHLSQDVAAIIDDEITNSIDKSDSELTSKSLNQGNNNLYTSPGKKLSAWVPKLSEEYRAYLIDYRKSWYEGKPLTWYTHLYVELLTLQFLVIDVLWSHISYQMQKWFRSVHRPRL